MKTNVTISGFWLTLPLLLGFQGNAMTAESKAAPAQVPTPLRGFADLHVHQFNNLGFGGRAFVGAAFGPIETALPRCDFDPDPRSLLPFVHGIDGTGDLLADAMHFITGQAKFSHPVGGFPSFDGWPRWDSFTHQSVYEDWLRRAVDGGLRLMVVLAGNNEVACELTPKAPGRTCNDMEAVDLEIQAAKDMEADIDRRCGGPGCGWYRIVKSPQEARAVIGAGKLAVVLGIEVDSLFNCSSGICTEEHVARELQRYYDLGVRHFFPIHFVSNQFGGAALYNVLTTAYSGIYPPQVRDGFDEGYRYAHIRYPRLPNGLPARAPVNAVGLTSLGRFFIRELMRKRAIIDVNHMSALSANETLDLVEPFHYPVVAGHCWFLDISNGDGRHEAAVRQEQVARIRDLGGIIGIILDQGKIDEIGTFRDGPVVAEHSCGNTSETVAQAYLYAVQQMQGGPVAFGSDFNGFAGLPGPRFGPEACPGGGSVAAGAIRVPYPFTNAIDGNLMLKSVVGGKIFDFNEDGLAHVGMLPDLIRDLQNQFGDHTEVIEPLMNSAEGYIRMWERIESSRVGVYVIPPSQAGCPTCGDGTEGNPYQDIQVALANARPAEYVYLSPGFYPALTSDRQVTLAKWPGRFGMVTFGN